MAETVLPLTDPRVVSVRTQWETRSDFLRVRVPFHRLFELFSSGESFRGTAEVLDLSSDTISDIYAKYFRRLLKKSGRERRERSLHSEIHDVLVGKAVEAVTAGATAAGCHVGEGFYIEHNRNKGTVRTPVLVIHSRSCWVCPGQTVIGRGGKKNAVFPVPLEQLELVDFMLCCVERVGTMVVFILPMPFVKKTLSLCGARQRGFLYIPVDPSEKPSRRSRKIDLRGHQDAWHLLA